MISDFQIFFVPQNSNECYSAGPLCSALQIEYPPLYMGETADGISQLSENILSRSSKFNYYAERKCRVICIFQIEYFT